MIRIDTDSYRILGQKYGLPCKKCGMSGLYDHHITSNINLLILTLRCVSCVTCVMQHMVNKGRENYIVIYNVADPVTT